MPPAPTTAITGGDERGSVTLFFAIAALALFAIFGLVQDGGSALAAKSQAAADAFAAARAGAQQLSPAALRTGQPTLNPTAARTAAQAVLAVDHLTGQVTVAGLTVTVTTTRTVPTQVLGLIGINTVTVHAAAAATAIPGP